MITAMAGQQKRHRPRWYAHSRDSRAFLRKEGHAHVEAICHLTGRRIFRTGKNPGQSGFTCPVDTNERDLFTSVDRQVKRIENAEIPIASCPDLSCRYNVPAAFRRFGKSVCTCLLLLSLSMTSNRLEHLDAALDLLGLGGLIPEALDEFLCLLDLSTLKGHLLFQGLQTPFLFRKIVRVVSLVYGESMIGELDDLIDHFVEEHAVVGNRKQVPW